MDGKDDSARYFKRILLILAVAVSVTLLAEYMRTPDKATIGYYLFAASAKLVSYSIVLLAIAALGAALMRKFRTHTFVAFAWLFLLAGSFDLIVAANRKYVVEPRIQEMRDTLNKKR